MLNYINSEFKYKTKTKSNTKEANNFIFYL